MPSLILNLVMLSKTEQRSAGVQRCKG